MVCRNESVLAARYLQHLVAFLGVKTLAEPVLVEVARKKHIDVSNRLAACYLEPSHYLEVEILRRLDSTVHRHIHVIRSPINPRMRMMIRDGQNVKPFKVSLIHPHLRCHLRI